MARKGITDRIKELGQLLVVGFDGTEKTSRLASLLTRVQPAGVIVFARNIKSAEQTWRLLRECQKVVATPLFACVDLEGGDVDRFRAVLGPAPSAAEVFATGDRRLYRAHGQIIGENCLRFSTVDRSHLSDYARCSGLREKVHSRLSEAQPR